MEINILKDLINSQKDSLQNNKSITFRNIDSQTLKKWEKILIDLDIRKKNQSLIFKDIINVIFKLITNLQEKNMEINQKNFNKILNIMVDIFIEKINKEINNNKQL